LRVILGVHFATDATIRQHARLFHFERTESNAASATVDSTIKTRAVTDTGRAAINKAQARGKCGGSKEGNQKGKVHGLALEKMVARGFNFGARE